MLFCLIPALFLAGCGSPTPSSEALITTLTINGLEGVATIDETKAVFSFDKLDSGAVTAFDLSVSPGATVTHADGTALTAENLVIGEEFPVLVTAEDGLTTQTYTLLITGDILITNKYSNGYYVWFDLTLHQNATVDFYAVEEGTTLPSADSVAAMDDTDGDQAVDGQHFRDALVAGEPHRIVLYNLDTSKNYDIGSYFSDAKYPDSHAAVLTQMTTAAEPSTTGKVVWQAYEGQRIILPPARLLSNNDIPAGTTKTQSLFARKTTAEGEEVIYHLYFLFSGNIYSFGSNYNPAIYHTVEIIIAPLGYYFINFTDVMKSQGGIYWVRWTEEADDTDSPDDYIDLRIIER